MMMSILIGVLVSAVTWFVLFLLYQAYKGYKPLFFFGIVAISAIALYYQHSRAQLNSEFEKGNDVVCHTTPEDTVISKAKGYKHEGSYFLDNNKTKLIHELECEAL
jgi:hypothetical protein